ncbi:ABC transporter substrate-binding protein [Lachnospiraceae bacterium ZAX-1]
MKTTKFTALFLVAALLMLSGCASNTPTSASSPAETKAPAESPETTADPTPTESPESTEVPATDIEDNSTRTQYPLTLSVPYAGGEFVDQTFDQAPERVIVLGQPIIDAMVYFGLQDKIVGVCYPEPALSVLPRDKYGAILDALPVLSEFNPNKETIIATEADLIITNRASMFGDDNLGTLEEINGRGTKVMGYQNLLSGIEEYKLSYVYENLERFGKVFDIQDEVAELIDAEKATVADIATKADEETSTEKPKILFIWRQGNDSAGVSFGRSNIATTLIELAGGESVLAEGALSKEALVEMNPDVILITQFIENGNELSSFYEDPAYQSLNAVKNKRVVIYDAATMDLIDVHFSLSETATKVAMAVHPEWYK